MKLPAQIAAEAIMAHSDLTEEQARNVVRDMLNAGIKITVPPEALDRFVAHQEQNFLKNQLREELKKRQLTLDEIRDVLSCSEALLSLFEDDK